MSNPTNEIHIDLDKLSRRNVSELMHFLVALGRQQGDPMICGYCERPIIGIQTVADGFALLPCGHRIRHMKQPNRFGIEPMPEK